MRRLGIIGAVTLALVAVIGVTTLAHAPGLFSVKANHAAQGGRLQVQAKGNQSVKGAYAALATVHFASGDVTVALVRKGRSAEASVKVPVSVTEQPGSVPVDVVITYLGTVQTLSTKGSVKRAKGGGDGGTDN